MEEVVVATPIGMPPMPHNIPLLEEGVALCCWKDWTHSSLTIGPTGGGGDDEPFVASSRAVLDRETPARLVS